MQATLGAMVSAAVLFASLNSATGYATQILSPYLLQNITSDQRINCKQATTIHEREQCREREVKAQESELLMKYHALQALIASDRAALQLLTEAHEHWLAWQWHESKLCASSAGLKETDTGFTLAQMNCRAALINTRLQQLDAFQRQYQSRLSR